MRIVHLVDLFTPSIGGTERAVEDLARIQAQRGAEVTVVTMTPAGATQVEIPGVSVIRIDLSRLGRLGIADPNRPYHPPFPLPAISQALRNIFQRLDAQVVIAHSWMIFSYLPLRSELEIPVVWYLHDYLVSCPKRTKIYSTGAPCPSAKIGRCIKCSLTQYSLAKAAVVTVGQHLSNRRLLAQVDQFIANSLDVATQAREVLANEVSVTVVGAAVNLGDGEQHLRPRPEFLPRGEYILFVGQLSQYKGLDDLLVAFSQINNLQVSLVCIGTPQPTTPTTWPKDVIVVHDVAHEQVLAAWQHCLFGVLPSHADSFGLVAVEAAFLGRAMVVTDVGGLKEVVKDGVTGLVVGVRDTTALQGAMETLLKSPERAAELGAAAAKHATTFRLEAVADRIDAVIATLVR